MFPYSTKLIHLHVASDSCMCMGTLDAYNDNQNEDKCVKIEYIFHLNFNKILNTLCKCFVSILNNSSFVVFIVAFSKIPALTRKKQENSNKQKIKFKDQFESEKKGQSTIHEWLQWVHDCHFHSLQQQLIHSRHSSL